MTLSDFEDYFGDPLFNFLAPLNIFGTDEAMHLKFGRQSLANASLWRLFLAHRHVGLRSFALTVSDS